MDLLTLTEIRRAVSRTGGNAVPARVHVQVEAATPKLTREQKPYCELTLADACDRMTLRVWSDHPAYKTCSSLTPESFIELAGEFHSHQQYGLEAQKWTVRPLTAQEKSELLQGPADLRARQNADWKFIVETIGKITDPRLRALCDAFVKDLGERFRRTAAARKNHHARRGGLVEHTAQMMRVALAIARLYPQLYLDLLIAGILFHDSGKLWENHYPESGFVMDYDERGELVGHISIGLELVNSLWRKISADNGDLWKNLSPLVGMLLGLTLMTIIFWIFRRVPPGRVDRWFRRLQLCSAAMYSLGHGTNDAQKTMGIIAGLLFAAGYLTAKPLAERIFERVWPLPSKLVRSLEIFRASSTPKDGTLL